MPVAPEPNPRLVFERLFGAGAPAERRKNLALRREQQRSILDFVLDDTRSLEKELGGSDQQKLDEYLAGVREIERRIQEAEQFKDTPNPAVETPAGIPGSFPEHIQLMFDMMVLAFQTDSTRIATFLLANEGSNRTFPEIGISEGHHNLSHHFGKKEMMEKIGSIDLWYVQQFARFLEKLESIKDVDGQSLLHNSMIVYGSGNADGNRHTHSNLPIILAGSGGGEPDGRPPRRNSNPSRSATFISTCSTALGVDGVARLGDSTGRTRRRLMRLKRTFDLLPFSRTGKTRLAIIPCAPACRFRRITRHGSVRTVWRFRPKQSHGIPQRGVESGTIRAHSIGLDCLGAWYADSGSIASSIECRRFFIRVPTRCRG